MRSGSRLSLKLFVELLLVFMIGGAIGIAYDWIHVTFRVLEYTAPVFAGTSPWVAVEFGACALAAHLAVQALVFRTHAHPRRPSDRQLLEGAALLLIAYLITGVFVGQNRATLLCLVPVALYSVYCRRDPLHRLTMVMFAILGPLGETLMSASGFFFYRHADPIPYWLSIFWIPAAVLITDASLRVHAGMGRLRSSSASR